MGNSPVPKHADDHHPDYGTDPLTFLATSFMPPTVILYNGSTTATSGSWKNVPFEDADVLYDPDGIYTIENVSPGTGDSRLRLKIAKQHWVVAEAEITWGNALTNPAVLDMNLGTAAPVFAPEYNALRSESKFTDEAVDLTMRIYTSFILHSTGAATFTLDPRAIQNDGVDRDLSGNYLKVMAFDIPAIASWTHTDAA